MSAEHSDYVHGSMPIEAQRETFDGFMTLTKYGASFISVVLLMPTLYYGADMSWGTSLIISLLFTLFLGLMLKLKGAWYACMMGLAIVTSIFCLFFSAVF